MQNKNKGIWIVSDSHNGCRSNSTEWLEITEEAHEKFIIPTIQKHMREGDILIHCGDLFDNRSSVNLKAVDSTIKSYEKLSTMLPVHILAGNHDIYYKNSTEISSIDILKWIPNVHIYKEPEIFNFGNERILLMPWRKDSKEETQTLEKFRDEFGCTYAFMHGTFSLIKYNKYVDINEEDGVSVNTANGYKRVITGHIHWRQEKENVLIVGCPYQITRGDSGNDKGIYYLDLETNELTFYPNDISPKFMSFTLNSLDKEYIKEIHTKSKNNFVDISIDSEYLQKNASSFNKLFHKISEGSRTLNIFPIEKDNIVLDETTDTLDTRKLIFDNIDKRFNDPTDIKKATDIIEKLIKDI